MTEWEPVIGLEIHVQLKTRTKMFCRCEVGYFEPRRTRARARSASRIPARCRCRTRRAVEWTIKLGLALGCEIAERAVFHRKNYFYPDIPKGYQISQYDEPLCVDGGFVVPEPEGDREVGIVRAHLEEDAAKNVHVGGAGGRIGGAAHSLVDFNRGGTPLVEIVTQPDLRSADEAKRFLQLLRQTIVELGISDAEMEKGTLRVDANVSVREARRDGLRTRTELKNMNSFTFIARGIEAEVARQIGVYESGGEVVQQTYDFDAVQRPAHAAALEGGGGGLPLLPRARPRAGRAAGRARRARCAPSCPSCRARGSAGSSRSSTSTSRDGLVTSGRDALYARRRRATVAAVANVLMNQFAGAGVDPDAVDARRARQADRGARERIPRAVFDEAIAESGDPGFRPSRTSREAAVSDAAELEPIVDRILAANPGQVEAYRGGKEGLLGFFVGQVMKETQGKADPKVVNELLREKLTA